MGERKIFNQYMEKESFWKKPLVRGITYAIGAIFVSYLPSLVQLILRWAESNEWPGFCFFFDSGNMISVWIPIFTMMVLSLFEIAENRVRSVWEKISFWFSIIIVAVSIPMFLSFRAGRISYAGWVRLSAIVVLCLLFVFLLITKYYEHVVHGDLTHFRKKDEGVLDEKFSKLK